MEFPIIDLLDSDLSEEWLLEFLHPVGLKCPYCGTDTAQARLFRRTKRSQIDVYRCSACDKTYNLYTGTIFSGKHLRPAQAVLLLRGILKGESSATLAQELGLSRTTVYYLRQELEAEPEQLLAAVTDPDDRPGD